MKKVFVGIDVSKEWLDFAVNQDLRVSEKFRVENTPSGISKAVNKLKRKFGQENLWFCMESTGNYGLLLSCILESSRVDYSVVPALEIKQSLGMTRGKTDEVDAARIAEYAAVHQHKLKRTTLPSEELIRIRQLLTYRSQLVKIRTQLKNSVKSHKLVDQVVKIGYIIRDLKKKISGLDQDIERIDTELIKEISSQKDLAKNFALASSVKGIGLIVAASFLVVTNNFTTFNNPRKFNCYAGIAPFENSSGLLKGKTRTSNLANKVFKTLLWNGATSAAVHDPQLKKYYKRKIEQGKPKMSVMNAVACKLVARVFAAVRRQSPYVILAN